MTEKVSSLEEVRARAWPGDLGALRPGDLGALRESLAAGLKSQTAAHISALLRLLPLPTYLLLTHSLVGPSELRGSVSVSFTGVTDLRSLPTFYMAVGNSKPRPSCPSGQTPLPRELSLFPSPNSSLKQIFHLPLVSLMSFFLCVRMRVGGVCACPCACTHMHMYSLAIVVCSNHFKYLGCSFYHCSLF